MIQAKFIDIKTIPAKPGVYFWYAKRNDIREIAQKLDVKLGNKMICVYIGKSSNLRLRFKWHTNQKYNAPRKSTLSWTLRSFMDMENANKTIMSMFFSFKTTEDADSVELKEISKNTPLFNLDDNNNKFKSIISQKRNEFKANHIDIWKK